MRKIAEAAGCSKMAVSLALRNHPRLPEATRLRIQKIAEEMGYRINPLVSTLMTQRAGGKIEGGLLPLALVNTFDHFSQFMDQEFYRLMVRGIFRRASALGFYGEVFHVNEVSGVTSRQLDKIFISRDIRGVIILPLSYLSITFDLSWDRYSVSTLGHSWQGTPVHRSTSDQASNAWSLLMTLREAGYRRPGLLLDKITHERSSGHFAASYYLYQKEHGDTGDIPLFLRTSATTDADIDRWVRKYRPDVIVGHGDETPGFIRRGWSIPESFGYASLGVLPSERDRLSGIDPRPELIGEAAVDLVVSRLHRNELGLSDHPRTTMIKGDWHEAISIRRQRVGGGTVD